MAIHLRIGVFKDPVSASTHFAGFLLAMLGAIILLVASSSSVPKLIAMAIYGVGLVGVFFASSVYHFFDFGERWNKWLKRLDHSAIFLMIGGSYVPIVTHTLEGPWRTTMLTLVAAIAVGGILLKMLWIDAPTWLGVTLYLAMGWLVVLPAQDIFSQMTSGMLLWLIIGGLSYTVGAFVYALQWPDPWPEKFGHHEIWHLFVLFGAAAHYGVMWMLIDAPVPGLNA